VKDRVEYAGKTYDIFSATDNDFKHRQTVLKCKETE
jgi:SPP1 family predicted phage head-tail adaptor